MCGIIGFSGSFDPALLELANKIQGHRGPDDSGQFVDPAEGIGLGHVRLSIIDLSSQGHQPMATDDGAATLIFNGEIYNFRELRIELEANGYKFRGHSDTEVLLQCYMAYGMAMLDRLNGIFSLGIWDKRSKSLFVARDALGVKPLYYAATAQGFAFASEIKALLPLVPQARELDAASLHRYLSFLWCPGEGTPLRLVRKVAPGEALEIREGRISKRWTWYQLPVFRGAVADLDEKEAIASTREILNKAVVRQLVADVPVGAFLSGGLDSSAIVSLARERAPDIRCFTIEATGGQEDGTVDDLPYAKRVAQHLGVNLDIVRIDATRMATDIERMIQQLDEPLADPAPLNVFYISQLARDHGMKVLLSGAGGDDLFTGYRRHVALNYEPCWRWMPQRFYQEMSTLSGKLDQRNLWFRRLAKLLDGAALTGDARLVNYFLWSKEAQLLNLYTPEFRSHLGQETAVSPMLDFLKPLDQRVSPMERMLALEQRFFLADHNLIYTDKMSMAVGLEIRVPFLDLELVEHAARIPARLKQRGFTGKWVLKKAMEPYLPLSVIYRAKSSFGAPLRRWMRHDLREILGDFLSKESLNKFGLFEPSAVQQLIAQNDTGRIDASYTLFSLLCIQIWCRIFLKDN